MNKLLGQKFNRLTIIKEVEPYINPNSGQKDKKYLCACDCGNEKEVRLSMVKIGKIKSCGCLLKETGRKNGLENIRHGFKGTKFYDCFQNMKQRCNNPKNHKYKDYGERGIKCLWENFEEFDEDMYSSYLEHIQDYGIKNTQIDRTDVNGDYCKENCRWVTILEQANNRRTKLRLYDIPHKLNEALSIEDESERDLALANLEMKAQEKITGIVNYVRLQENFDDQIDIEIKRLQELKRTRGNRVEGLKGFLKGFLGDVLNTKKLETPNYTLTVCKKPARVEIEANMGLPDEYLTAITTTKPNKALLKEHLKEGKSIRGVFLVENETYLKVK